MNRRHVALAAILLALVIVVVLARSLRGNDGPNKNSAYRACVDRLAGSHPTKNSVVWAKSQCAIDPKAFAP